MIRFIQEEKEEKEMAGIEKFWNSAERKGSKGKVRGKILGKSGISSK